MYAQSNLDYGNYIMDSFEFESGVVLKNVAVEYATSGVPKYDDEGNITNVIIYCPTLKGSSSILADYHDLIIKHDFNRDRYFFIKIVSLGAPDSCSPSSTGLKHSFPEYTFKDRVNFKKQFLDEKFKIDKIMGIIGEGMGGFETYTWACEYPDDMEFIIVVNSAFKTHGFHHVFVKCVESMIESSDDFYSNEYSPNLSQLIVAINRLLFAGYFSINILESLSCDEIDILMDDYVDSGLFMDIHDFKSRNDCISKYDVEDKLGNIKAKSLILAVWDYLFSNPEKDCFPLENLIENSTVRVFNYKTDDYRAVPDYSEMILEMTSFLEQFVE